MKKVLIIFITTAMLLAPGLMFTEKTQAVTAADWRAGRIIDDSVFTNAGSMSVADIQNFLNGKVPWCDYWGTQTSELGGGTRAQYGAAHSNPAPFTCLRDYYEVPKTEPGPDLPQSNYGSSTIPSGAVSAAQIIYDAAQKYSISPKALLVKLATESPGPLTSDVWPFKRQYLYAMGAHCPDSGPNGSANCDSNYAGFSLQMDEAASLLRWYLDSMQQSWWKYKKPYQTNSILWNVVETGCGAGDVYIESKATAALYTYTPYQPNAAALNNMYGTGDGCSAYGNRNFWRVWSDWFGPTVEGVSIASPLRVVGASPVGAFTNSATTVAFDISNATGSPINIGGMAVAVRDSAGNNYDYPLQDMVVPARSTVTYSQTKQFTKEDTYSFEIVNFQNGYWNNTQPISNNPGYDRKLNSQIYNMPTVISALRLDQPNLHVGQSTAVRFSTLNNSSQFAMNLGYMGVAMASPSGKNADLPFDTVANLAPGVAYNYFKTFIPQEQGTYRSRISATRDSGRTWSEGTFPAAQQGSSNRLDVNVRPSVTLTQGLTVDNTTPRAGDTVTGTFKVRNFSDSSVVINKSLCYVVRGNNKNYDFGCMNIGTLASGQEQTFSASRNVGDAGVYKAFFSMYDGAWHDNWSFDQETGAEPKALSFTVKSNPTLTQGLTIDNTTPRAGDTVTGTFKVRNSGNSVITVNKLLCYIVRGVQNQNYDLGCMNIGTLDAGQEQVFSATRNIGSAGVYKAYFSMYDGRSWHDNWSFDQETGAEAKALTFTARANPTLTQGLAVSNANPHAGDGVLGSFTVSNKGNATITVDKLLCYIVRDAQNRNYDLGCSDIKGLASGQSQTFSASRQLPAGTYRAHFAMYDGAWHDNWSFDQETGAEAKALTFTVKTTPVLVQGLTLDTVAPNARQAVTGSFKVKNASTVQAQVNKTICYIVRDAQNQNYDLGCMNIGTLDAGQEQVFSASRQLPAGTYRAHFAMYDGAWHDNWSFDQETGAEVTRLNFTVVP